MSTALLSTIVPLMLAPVVMISSCAIILNGLLSHYAEVNERLRGMNRERFDLLRAAGTQRDIWVVERLHELDRQAPELLKRHRTIHTAVLSVDYAIMLLMGAMLATALTAAVSWPWLTPAVLGLILAGTMVLLFAVLLTAGEIRSSRHAIEFETDAGLRLSARHLTPSA